MKKLTILLLIGALAFCSTLTAQALPIIKQTDERQRPEFATQKESPAGSFTAYSFDALKEVKAEMGHPRPRKCNFTFSDNFTLCRPGIHAQKENRLHIDPGNI